MESIAWDRTLPPIVSKGEVQRDEFPIQLLDPNSEQSVRQEDPGPRVPCGLGTALVVPDALSSIRISATRGGEVRLVSFPQRERSGRAC